MAQPDGDVVHYFRAPVEQLRYVDDQPFDVDHTRKLAAIQEAWLKAQAWLEDRGLEFREGVIAAPQELRFIDGDIAYLL